MISPKTPAGTRIVCLDSSPSDRYAAFPDDYDDDMDGLAEGAVYIVRAIIADDFAASGFAVQLREIIRFEDTGYDLGRFELAALPKAITDCLETVDLPLIIDEFKREDADAAMRLLLPYA